MGAGAGADCLFKLFLFLFGAVRLLPHDGGGRKIRESPS